jgi:hypothetical protein
MGLGLRVVIKAIGFAYTNILNDQKAVGERCSGA